MWNVSRNLLLRIVLCSLLAFCCCFSSVGYTKTTTAMTESVTIPIQQWQTLKSEFNLLNQDLIQCQQDLSRLKKPSAELLNELTEAQKMLKQLQEDFNQQKADLTMLSNEVGELRTLSTKLKEQINKERAVHRRQIWQNRIWCLLIGAGVGVVASR